MQPISLQLHIVDNPPQVYQLKHDFFGYLSFSDFDQMNSSSFCEQYFFDCEQKDFSNFLVGRYVSWQFFQYDSIENCGNQSLFR